MDRSTCGTNDEIKGTRKKRGGEGQNTKYKHVYFHLISWLSELIKPVSGNVYITCRLLSI
jgi:hypothetical protein